MRNAGLEEAQAGIKIARRNINNLRYADDTTLMEENEEELKSPLMRMKEESEKAGLKLHIEKITSWHPVHHFMANRWGKSGSSDRFSLHGLQNHYSVCSLEIKRCSLEGKPRQHIEKQRYLFADKDP